jgi:hypothetical protein
MSSEIEASLEELRQECDKFSLDICKAIREKAKELRIRQFLKCIPNSALKEESVSSFLQLVLGREPEDSLVKSVCRSKRQRVLCETEKIELEKKQNFRCALCGEWLTEDQNPHVDHVIPISLGGPDTLVNMQLLCRKCNLGKSAVIDWVMGAPFLYSDDSRISTGLRYCVLAHSSGICSDSSCQENSRECKLEVCTIIPQGSGGRMIFDNLRVLCSHHYEEQQEMRQKLTRSKLYRSKMLGKKFLNDRNFLLRKVS